MSKGKWAIAGLLALVGVSVGSSCGPIVEIDGRVLNYNGITGSPTAMVRKTSQDDVPFGENNIRVVNDMYGHLERASQGRNYHMRLVDPILGSRYVVRSATEIADSTNSQ